jgi:hypothetical protein
MKSRRKSRRKPHGGRRPGAGRPALEPQVEAAPIAPSAPALPQHLQTYWDSRGPHFRMCFEHLPTGELTDLLQSCLENRDRGCTGLAAKETPVSPTPNDTFSDPKIIADPPLPPPQPDLPDSNPNPRNITGDPHQRADNWPVNPEAHWHAEQVRQDEAAAAARWSERNRS